MHKKGTHGRRRTERSVHEASRGRQGLTAGVVNERSVREVSGKELTAGVVNERSVREASRGRQGLAADAVNERSVREVTVERSSRQAS